MNDYTARDIEAAILSLYSTEGLRKNQLTRDEKKAQLESMGIFGDDRDVILRFLYGEDPNE